MPLLYTVPDDMMRSYYAILTADIVSSRNLQDKSLWLLPFKSFLIEAQKRYGYFQNDWSFYRGDGFQISINPLYAFEFSIVLRSFLKSLPIFNAHEMDIRISVGLGVQTYQANVVAESDGPAYQYSGKLLDKMANLGWNLALSSPWPDLNEEMKVVLKLLDLLTKHWTIVQARTVHDSLYRPGTQQELAKKWKITQPAVQKRIQRANIDAIKMVDERYRTLVSKYIYD